jgi:hypothetical protein
VVTVGAPNDFAVELEPLPAEVRRNFGFFVPMKGLRRSVQWRLKRLYAAS